MLITGPHNDIIKQIIALKQKKNRDEQGLFIVEGQKQVSEIPKDWKIKYTVTTENDKKRKDNGNIDSASERYRSHGMTSNIQVYEVSKQLFKKISGTETPQGILAVVEKKKYDIEKTLNLKGIFIVCDNLQDPGNVGTIIRTAEAFSCKGIFLSKNSADVYGDKVVRATMGAIFNIPLFQECDIVQLIKTFKEKNIRTCALALDGSKNLQELKLNSDSAAIIVGNEAKGISPEVLNITDDKIKIEMTGKAESLNAAIATAIAIYNLQLTTTTNREIPDRNIRE